MKVKFKKFHADAVLPSYAKPGDAGLDLTCISISHTVDNLDNGPYTEYETGLAVEIPEGYVGLVFPRSSISKYPTRLCNSVGVVDSGYRGSIKIRMRNDNSLPLSFYKKGEKVAQLVIIPYPTIEPEEASELSTSERGTGGFGSTGS